MVLLVVWYTPLYKNTTFLNYLAFSCITNYSLWFLLYGSSYYLVYYKYQTECLPYKFNKKYPPEDLMIKEIQRSAVCVAVAIIYDMMFYSFGTENNINTTNNIDSDSLSSLLVANVPLAVGLVLWSDFHFYAYHRILHQVKWLYKNVHKIHHESINPNPWSGLSFHPLEGSLYFSALCIALIIPIPEIMLHVFRLGLLLAPLGGHIGHGLKMKQSEVGPVVDVSHHYLHHQKFSFNYGSGLFGKIYDTWDILLDTNWVEKQEKTNKERD